MEENKQLDIEFKTTVIRFFKNFLEKADKFNETLEDMKKDQLEIKHTLTEIKNIIQRPNSRLEERKNQAKDLEYKEAKDTPLEKQEEKRIQKVEDSVRSLWDNFKRTNIRIMGVPEEEREQDTENLFEEIMTENFPHLKSELAWHLGTLTALGTWPSFFQNVCYSRTSVQAQLEVNAYTNFDADRDALNIETTIKNKGVNEITTIDILTNCSNEQRQDIAFAYQRRTKKELASALKSAFTWGG
ncbi:hypothetical protein QTO34_019366 [Cnephaeus nilssonii]|uniref:Uncharacterized protein n=1 Tax=Cnephaeus nilssonii TaxID=3371016 RepID=A0AA40HWJ2_CNENI|nr:hypothetical protein QTO34_019366 [Eptesicus nilssonii]